MSISNQLLLGMIALTVSACMVDAGSESDESLEVVGSARQALGQPDLIVDSVTLWVDSGTLKRTVVIKNQGDVATNFMTYCFRQVLINQTPPAGVGLYGATWAPTCGSIAANGGTVSITTPMTGWTVTAIEQRGGQWQTSADWGSENNESDETNNVSLFNNDWP
ncbi:hypothetical protein [Sorangium sp. So ce1151]|uniref:hypothetical protein n=1 Tax=Sorangium sp. So ce1151 TaxID=3133332 RepID=UPI003F5E3D1C